MGPDDLFVTRRCFLRIGPDARISLCHAAGAPWSARDPDGARLSPEQVRILRREEREKIVHAGSGGGKSVLGGCEALVAVMDPSTKGFVVGQRYDHVGHEFGYLVEGLRRLFGSTGRPCFRRLTFRNSANYHDFEVDAIWGSSFRGLTMGDDDGASLLGHHATHVILAEGSYVEKDILERRIARALDRALMARSDGLPPRRAGFLTIYTTPREFGGCSAAEYDRVFRYGRGSMAAMNYGRVPWVESVWFYEGANADMNPAYDREALEARRRTMDPAAFAEQYLGKMTYRSGRIYDDFDEGRHVVKRAPDDLVRGMRLGFGIDTGAYFGGILAGLARDGRIYLMGEAYTEKRKLSENLSLSEEAVRQRLESALGTRDFAKLRDRVELWVVDPASQQKLEIMDQLGTSLQHPARGKGVFELIPTIEVVRNLFATDRLVVEEDLVWTVDQLRKYVWKMTRPAGQKEFTIREPKKTYDHLMDAMRFVVVPLSEMDPSTEPPRAVTPQEFFREGLRARAWGPLRRQIERARRRGGVPVF